MFLCDYHTHSHHSFDADRGATVDALCRAAIERGVTDLAITDHFECNWRTDCLPEYGPRDTERALQEILEARERYRGRLHLTFGMEIGQANQCPEEAAALLERFPFEFVIGSLHNLTGTPDFAFLDFHRLKEYPAHVEQLFRRYLREAAALPDALPQMHTLAHLTYMHRYCALAGCPLDLSLYTEELEVLFCKLVQRNIALEVNVSTLWKGLGFSMPDRPLLELYRDCGGRLVTIGTDSHTPTHVGECIPDAMALLRSIGLCRVLVVREGERTEIEI